jgi:predicted heme/steroid binding protein
MRQKQLKLHGVTYPRVSPDGRVFGICDSVVSRDGAHVAAHTGGRTSGQAGQMMIRASYG